MLQLTDNELYRIISSNIKAYRISAGINQHDLADKANISYSYLSKIESNGCDKTFSISVLNQIANALNRDITDFFKENVSGMKQVDIIVMALKNLGGQASYSEIYQEYARITREPLTDGKKAGIRKNVEDYSSDSENYKNKGDYFYSVYGKGKGYWGLRK